MKTNDYGIYVDIPRPPLPNTTPPLVHPTPPTIFTRLHQNIFIQIIFIYKDILHLFWLFYQIFNLFSTNLYMVDILYIYGNLIQAQICLFTLLQRY